MILWRQFRNWGWHAACLAAMACKAAPPGPDPDPSGGALNIQLTSASASSAPGSTVTISVTVTAPTAYTGGVTLAADGLPAGVTLVSSSVTTSGTTVTGLITLQVSASAVPGAYTLNVRATGSGVSSATATFALTIQAVSEAVVRTVPCGPIAVSILWFGYLNASGAWVQVTGSGGEYRFPVSSATGTYAYVTSYNGATGVSVNQLTRAELTAGPIGGCSTAGGFGLNRLTGTISPSIGAQELVFLWMGVSGTSLSAGSSSFTFNNGPDEPFDLIATRGSNPANGYTDRILLRRDVTAPNGSSLGVLDFNGPDGATPVPAQIGVSGGEPGGSVSVALNLLTRAACHSAGLGGPPGQINGTSFTVYGLPSGRLRATDYYQVSASQVLTVNNIRGASETFQQLAGRVIALPPSLGTLAFTNDPGNFRRLRVAFTGASEYKMYSMSYTAGGKGMAVSASAAYLGSNAVVLSTPSFSAAPGWSDSWAPPTTGSATWTISATGRSVSGTSCQPGRSVDAQRRGSL